MTARERVERNNMSYVGLGKESSVVGKEERRQHGKWQPGMFAS